MGRHHQMRQRKLRRNGWCDRPFNPARQSRQFARDPVRPHGVQNAKLTAARGSSTAIGEVDDLTLSNPINGGVRLFNKTFQAFGKPVISASLLAVAIHSLLDYDPLAIVGHDEAVKIKVEAILHGGAVHLGDEPAAPIRQKPRMGSHRSLPQGEGLGSVQAFGTGSLRVIRFNCTGPRLVARVLVIDVGRLDCRELAEGQGRSRFSRARFCDSAVTLRENSGLGFAKGAIAFEIDIETGRRRVHKNIEPGLGEVRNYLPIRAREGPKKNMSPSQFLECYPHAEFVWCDHRG